MQIRRFVDPVMLRIFYFQFVRNVREIRVHIREIALTFLIE